MRPLELRLRNFRSYAEPEAMFDFRDRSLVGVVGPIGSGKSSLLDGIAFALYGKTPSEGSATTTLIHQRADNGGVSFRFAVDGEVWEAVRLLRRKGQSRHDLYRYGDDTADAERIETVSGERDVNERVRELLGLDFDTFGRSVLLAQGRFAEFLRGQPRDRDRVLKGVFGHDRIDRMREVAKQRAADLGERVAGIRGQLVEIDALEARLAAKVTESAEVQARVEALDAARPGVESVEERIAAATGQAARARERLEELRRQGAELPDPAAVADADQLLSGMNARREELGADLDAADTARQEAEAAVADLDRAGERELLVAADRQLAVWSQATQRLVDKRGEQERATDELEQRRAGGSGVAADLDASVAAVSAAEQAEAEARAAYDLASEARHVAVHADMATELRTTLGVGEPCPVCLHVVTDPPPVGAASGLAAAKAAEAEAEAAWDSARSARSEAEAMLAGVRQRGVAIEEAIDRLESDLKRRDEDLAAQEGLVAATAEELTRLLGKGDPVELLASRRSRLEALDKAKEAARLRFETVRADLDRVVAEQQNVEGRVGELRRVFDRLAGWLGMFAVDGPLGELAAAVRQRWESESATATKAAERSDADRAAAVEERSVLLGSLGITGDFRDELTAARALAKALVDDIARDGTEVAKADALRAEQASAGADRACLDRIAKELTDTRFVRFLLDDERARLAELGGEHFLRMTSGRYRFTDDGAFDIVDQNAADTVRKASSLSGGETFLASLALALALAEMVTREGGRLESFFLDEGFGSLDPEHLDLAMEGIEDLVADGSSRLVVVVSHVPEMQERITDLIVLDRHALTGDTVVRRG